MQLIEKLDFERSRTTLINFINIDSINQIYLHNDYETYVNIAYVYMENLLKATETLNGNLIKKRDNNSLQVITWSFMAIESFISFLLKLYYCNDEDGFKEIISEPLINRMKQIFNIFKIKLHKRQKSTINSYIDDFCTFRNDIFHDRILRITRTYKKALFSKCVNEYNLSNTIQSYSTMINLFHSFRYIIESYDFISKILFKEQNKIFNIDLEHVYTNYQIHTLTRVLRKHNYYTLIKSVF